MPKGMARSALRLQEEGAADHGCGAQRHRVAMGKMRETQDREDQRDPQRAECQLAAIGEGRDEHEVGDADQRVERFHGP